VEAEGLNALSVRGLAIEVGTSTRAVYSLFGSKDGLISALGERTFQLLGTAVEALPTTQDAALDLVEAGVSGFRCLVVDHPGLFKLGIQQTYTTAEQVIEIQTAAARAWKVLVARVGQLEQQGRLGTRSVQEAATLLVETFPAESACPSQLRIVVEQEADRRLVEAIVRRIA